MTIPMRVGLRKYRLHVQTGPLEHNTQPVEMILCTYHVGVLGPGTMLVGRVSGRIKRVESAEREDTPAGRCARC